MFEFCRRHSLVELRLSDPLNNKNGEVKNPKRNLPLSLILGNAGFTADPTWLSLDLAPLGRRCPSAILRAVPA